MATASKQIVFDVGAAQSSTVLSQAFGALSSGGSASFSPGAETVFGVDDYAWQTIFHHDVTNNEIHLLGKPANQTADWKHRRYFISSNTWSTVTLSFANTTGHIYGNSALDTVTGDVYCTTNNNLSKWTRSTNTWSQVVANLISGTSHKNGVAFHPNLFGSGQRGLVIQSTTRVLFYNPVTNGTTLVSGFSDTGENAGAGIYFSAIGKTITGYINQLRVTSSASIVQGPSTPIWTRGYSTTQGAIFGALVQHPLNPAKMLLIERNTDVSTARRYWSSTDGNNWTLVGTHPILTTNVFCSVVNSSAANSGIWALGPSSYSFIWKPAA